MEKNKSLEWIKEKFETGKDEVVKLTKIGKIRIEITSLNKKKDEKLLEIGKKTYQLILDGKISEDYFEPDYSALVNFEEKIQELINEIEEIKTEEGTDESVVVEEATEEVAEENREESESEEEQDEPIVMTGEVSEETEDSKEEAEEVEKEEEEKKEDK
jgi:hypothetical protein